MLGRTRRPGQPQTGSIADGGSVPDDLRKEFSQEPGLKGHLINGFWEGHGFHSLRKKSMRYVILGGAAVYRCDKRRL